MDTLTFLQTILPPVGTHYVVLFKENFPYPIHRGYQDLGEMAEAIASYNRDPNIKGVYHACGAYKLPYVEIEKDGKTRKQYRKPNNWRCAKAFWLDLDCGEAKAEAGQGYATKKDAAIAVSKFAKEVGWPQPMLVSSGNGLHAYWPLTAAVAHTSWTKCADLLKAAAALHGLLADPTRTADFASILRPVGTSNRKDPANPKKVSVLRECEPADAKTLYDAIKAYASTHDVVVPQSSLPALPSYMQGAEGINADLTGHLGYSNAPVDAELMASKCQQVGRVAHTGGDATFDHWRLVIGLLTFCEDGRTKAEEWTSRREETDHSNLDWQTRYDSWDAGPTLCEKLDACNPGGCTGCEFKGKVNTPLVLGRVIPITQETQVEVATETEAVEVVTVPAYPPGYQWNNGLLSRILPDKDGINQVHSFTTHQFYPTMRIRGEDGTYKIGMRMHLHNGRLRDFQMPFEAMASPTDMLKSLAKYELMQTNHANAGTHLTAYLRDSLEQLKRRVEETNTLTSFGWKDDMRGFLIGDRYYTADGVRRVLLGGYAAQKQAALAAPVGTLAGYASPLNYVYRREGMEALQYAICSGWGSILNPFCEELYCGLLLAITGGDSGKGKSTAAYASVYAFGDSNAMALKSDDAGTRNALWATVGAFNNVPLIFDELTGVEAEWFSNFTYTLSLGEERARLQATGNGVKFAAQSRWRMSPFGTANKDLHGVLAATQANSQAEAVRLIQIHVDSYPIPKLEETEVQMALEQMKRNRGCAGAALIQYAVSHREALADRIRNKVAMLVEHVPGTKYRFYRSHAACTLVAAEMAVELGICEFDVDKLTEFAISLMQKLAKEIAINNTISSDDAFSRMVASMQPGIVVTSEYRDSRSALGVETPRNQIRGPVVGRYVLGSRNEKAYAGRMFLCQKTAREWCTKNRTDFNVMMDHLRDAGALVTEDERITLTRGTDMPRIQQRCIVVDTTRLENASPVLVVDNSAAPGQSAV